MKHVVDRSAEPTFEFGARDIARLELMIIALRPRSPGKIEAAYRRCIAREA